MRRQCQAQNLSIRRVQAETGVFLPVLKVVCIVVGFLVRAIDELPGVIDILRHRLLHDHRPLRLGGELPEGIPQVLHIAVDVKMVGIHRGDDRHFGMQGQEGAIELVGLHHGGAGIRAADVVVA